MLIVYLCAQFFLHAGYHDVAVPAGRVYLHMIMPQVEEPWKNIDLGPAPQPMQHRLISANFIESRLHEQKIKFPAFQIPKLTRIFRPGQIVVDQDIKRILKEYIQAQMPPHLEILRMQVPAQIVVGPGEIKVDIADKLLPGTQQVIAHFYTDDGSLIGEHLKVPVTLDIYAKKSVQQRASYVVERGSQVNIILMSHYIKINTTGIAQQPGSIGDMIGVIPDHGKKVVRGYVTDAKTVEIK